MRPITATYCAGMQRRKRIERYHRIGRLSAARARLFALGLPVDSVDTIARIHRKFAEHGEPEVIADYYHWSVDAVAVALLSFDYHDWIGRQKCDFCGAPPGERDRGVLTRYRGGYACNTCIQGPGASDSDWFDFVKLLLDAAEDQRDDAN